MFPVSSKTLKAGENGRREIAKKNAEKKYIKNRIREELLTK